MISKRTTVFGVCLGGCACVLVLAAFMLWRPLLVAYYVSKLESDPEYALKLVGGDGEVTPEVDEALRRFLGRNAGREWLVGELWTLAIQPAWSRSPGDVEVGVVYLLAPPRGVNSVWRHRSGRVEGRSSRSLPDNTDAYARLATRAAYRRVPIDGQPEWVVTLASPEAPEVKALSVGPLAPPPATILRCCILDRVEAANADGVKADDVDE